MKYKFLDSLSLDYMQTLIKIAFSLLIATAMLYTQPINIVEAPIIPIPEDIPGKIQYYANKYSISSKMMNAVVKCESGYKPTIIGDNGTSYGIVQIHLPIFIQHCQINQIRLLLV